jgi:hypothetical protein
MAQDYCLVCQMRPLPGKDMRAAVRNESAIAIPRTPPSGQWDAKRRMWTFSSRPTARKLAISDEPP